MLMLSKSGDVVAVTRKVIAGVFQVVAKHVMSNGFVIVVPELSQGAQRQQQVNNSSLSRLAVNEKIFARPH